MPVSHSSAIQRDLDKAKDDILILLVVIQHLQTAPINWQEAQRTAKAPPCRVSFQSLRSRYHSILERYGARGLKSMQATGGRDWNGGTRGIDSSLPYQEGPRAKSRGMHEAKRPRLSGHIQRRMQAAETDELEPHLTALSSNPPAWFQEQQQHLLAQANALQPSSTSQRNGISKRELLDLTLPAHRQGRMKKEVSAIGHAEEIKAKPASLIVTLKVDYRRNWHLLSAYMAGSSKMSNVHRTVSLRRPAMQGPYYQTNRAASSSAKSNTSRKDGRIVAEQEVGQYKRESSELSSPPASSSSISSPATGTTQTELHMQPGLWNCADAAHEEHQDDEEVHDFDEGWILPTTHGYRAPYSSQPPLAHDSNIQILADAAAIANKHYEEELHSMLAQPCCPSSDDGFAMLQQRLFLEQRLSLEETGDGWESSHD